MAAPLDVARHAGLSGGQARWVVAADGVRLRLCLWPGERGTVLVLTGRAEFAERYGDAVTRLRGAGYAVALLDSRGQGASDRPLTDRRKGHMSDFRTYQKDLDAVLAHLDGAGWPAPRFLLAHSMGGMMGWRRLVEGDAFAAAVLVAPLLDLPLAPALRGALRLATGSGLSTAYAPGQGPVPYPLRQPFLGNALTTDRTSYARHRGDLRAHPELALGGPTFGWIRAALTESAALRALPPPRQPVHLLVGRAEWVVDPKAIRRAADRLPNGQLTVVEGARHGLLMEGPQPRGAVWSAILGHFGQQPSS